MFGSMSLNRVLDRNTSTKVWHLSLLDTGAADDSNGASWVSSCTPEGRRTGRRRPLQLLQCCSYRDKQQLQQQGRGVPRKIKQLHASSATFGCWRAVVGLGVPPLGDDVPALGHSVPRLGWRASVGPHLSVLEGWCTQANGLSWLASSRPSPTVCVIWRGSRLACHSWATRPAQVPFLGHRVLCLGRVRVPDCSSATFGISVARERDVP